MLDKNIKSVIFGMEGEKLTISEKDFFKEINPIGFILFKRNCNNPAQVKSLCNELKELSDREDVLIAIDQEGGRVARLKQPMFNEYPKAAFFASIAENKSLEDAKRMVYLNALLMANDLKELGINVNCTPVVDLLFAQADPIISDRSYGANINQVVALAKQVILGHLDLNIRPIIKHIPGHGRANVDSHFELPVIDTSLQDLEQSDFAIFKQLNDQAMAMSAHIIYNSLDKNEPVTLSKPAIDYIRNKIGFNQIIMTDDLEMKALKGDLTSLSTRAIEAGCDMLLHCSGDLSNMKMVAKAAPFINDRVINSLNKNNLNNKNIDIFQIKEEYQNLVKIYG